eukprot:3442275-Prymnesium_polylepis.1
MFPETTPPHDAPFSLQSAKCCSVNGEGTAASCLPISPAKCTASALAVGSSNVIVDDSDTPVKDRSLVASSDAPRESTPASISGVSTPTAEPPAISFTARTTVLSTRAARCVMLSVASNSSNSLRSAGSPLESPLAVISSAPPSWQTGDCNLSKSQASDC